MYTVTIPTIAAQCDLQFLPVEHRSWNIGWKRAQVPPPPQISSGSFSSSLFYLGNAKKLPAVISPKTLIFSELYQDNTLSLTNAIIFTIKFKIARKMTSQLSGVAGTLSAKNQNYTSQQIISPKKQICKYANMQDAVWYVVAC